MNRRPDEPAPERIRGPRRFRASRAERGDFRRLFTRVESTPLSAAAREAAREDLRRIAGLPPAAGDARTSDHLRWLVDLPWAPPVPVAVDLVRAREILDGRLSGLEDVKERILEVLAVLKTAPPRSLLCLVGPPGVGKTSLARAIAEAASRPFVQVSVAGVDDGAVLKGRPADLAGAVPGKVIQGLRRAGSRAPVFVLDEIDRIGSDGEGPVASLLEVVDPDLNAEFVDLYLDVPFDLSSVLFVATAAVAYDVERSLRDRLEVLTLPGYTRAEKVLIARRHLLPHALERAGLAPEEVRVEDEALFEIAKGYTREAGVRGLDRMLSRLSRRLALLRETGRTVPERIAPQEVRDLLGPPLHADDQAMREPSVGVAAGLAWTADGGVVQWIEVASMKGSGHVLVTGRLGDVMRESADIAYSWARANAQDLGLAEEDVTGLDLHVHAPEGDVKKDGPSAGVALVTAIVSVFTHRPVRSDVAMTGELTLRGKVLDVGGIREKVSAAHRAGIREILLPEGNRKDVDALTPDLRRDTTFRFLETVREYLDAALLAKPGG